jgi:hypothetical protein
MHKTFLWRSKFSALLDSFLHHTWGKKGPLTTTEDLSACKSNWSLIRIYTVNTLPHALVPASAGPPTVRPAGDVMCSSAAARVASISPPLHRGTTHTPPVGLPLTPPWQTFSPASSRHRPRLPSSSLDLTQARTAACSPALHWCSPNFEPRWQRRHCSPEPPLAKPPPPITPWWVQSYTRVTCWPPRPWISIEELTPTGEVTVVNPRGIVVNQGPSCKSL